MASYDNKHWLLSHIRNSFIVSDDTGLCEIGMGGENIAHQLHFTQYECYPGVEESDGEDEADVMSQSYDLHAATLLRSSREIWEKPRFLICQVVNSRNLEEIILKKITRSDKRAFCFGPRGLASPMWSGGNVNDLDFGRPRRYRSNTAVRLQKMDEERKIAANTRHVHWDKNPATLTAEEKSELFKRKDFRNSSKGGAKIRSLLSEMIQNHPTLPANPFREYAKFDGDSQWGQGVRCFKIWLTMLKNDKRNFPMKVTVMATARVLDLIGLVCWRCMAEYTLDETALKDSVDYYTLHIAEDDGEVDWDFPCLDNKESVTKFTFNFLALVESDPKKEPPDRLATRHVIMNEPAHRNRERVSESDTEKKQGDIDARIRAPIYESFKVYMMNKVRTKTEVHLGVSGDKVEVDPVMQQQRVSVKFFGRHKSSTHDMDSVVACDLIETKSNNRAIFRLVYDHSTLSTSLDSSSTCSPSFKHHDFETTADVASSIVQKINHILELKPSTRRKEYLSHREHKSHRRKSFHLGPR